MANPEYPNQQGYPLTDRGIPDPYQGGFRIIPEIKPAQLPSDYEIDIEEAGFDIKIRKENNP